MHVWLLVLALSQNPSGPRGTGIVRVDPAPPTLIARLQGQLADLDWRLSRGDEPATVRVAVEARPDGGLRVRLQAPDGRRYRRDIVGLGAAATEEAAAVVLRSALLAIEEGVAPAWTDEPPPRANPTQDRWGWALGGRLASDGLPAAPGLEARLFRRWGRWALGGQIGARWPAEVRGAGTELEIQRWDARALAGFDIPHARWTLGGSAGIGARIWERQTLNTDAAFRPEDPRSVAGVVLAAAFRLGFRIDSGWFAALEVGADGLIGAPRWALEDGTDIRSPWPVQPWLGLSVGRDPIFVGPR